jgi:hypothetical protein
VAGLWVAEQGTGNDDGGISGVTPDGSVHPFLTNQRSLIYYGSPLSFEQIHFHSNRLWATYVEGSFMAIDTTGFSPEGPPLALDTTLVVNIKGYIQDEGFPESNPYDFTFGPDNDLYMVDAAANVVIRRSASDGMLDVFATFDKLSNPTNIGPPVADVVPTGIVFTGDRFLTSTLSGFPFAEGMASVYAVDLDGNVSVFQDGFTQLTDLLLHPSTGALLVLEMGRFEAGEGFLPNTGTLLAVKDGAVTTLVTELNRPAGMTMGPNGDLFVTSYTAGEVLRIDAALITGAASSP